MKDEAVEALIREGVRRERARWVALLAFEARGRSPLVRDVILSISAVGEAGDAIPDDE